MALVAVLLTTHANCPGERVNGPRWEVELDLYSGRPNPRWELTAEEGRELLRRLGDLEGSAAGFAPEPPGLGYRGFILVPVGPDDGLTERIEVYGGTITIHRGRKAVHYRDSRDVEEWLFRQAEGRGHPIPAPSYPP